MTRIQMETCLTDQTLPKATPSLSTSTNRTGWSSSPRISAQMEQEIRRLKRAIREAEVPRPDRRSSVAGSTSSDIQGQTSGAWQPEIGSPVETITLPVDYIWSLESKLSYYVSQIRLRQEESKSILALKEKEISTSKSQFTALKKSHTTLENKVKRCMTDFQGLAADMDAIEERMRNLETKASWAEQNVDMLRELQRDIEICKKNRENAFRTLESQYIDMQAVFVKSKGEDDGKTTDAECDSSSANSVDDVEKVTWDGTVE